MRSIILLALSLWLAGCSFFGIYNRSNDYIKAEEHAPTLMTTGEVLRGIDRYQIPEAGYAAVKPESIEVPAPLPLLDDPEADSASLNAYRNTGLNSRLEFDGAGALVMHVDGNFTVIWAAITDAIAASSLKLVDLNRSTGTWYLEIEENQGGKQRRWWAPWRKDKITKHIYLLKLSRTRLGGYVSLLKDSETLASETLNKVVLEELQQKLEK